MLNQKNNILFAIAFFAGFLFANNLVVAQNSRLPYSERKYHYIQYDSTELEHFDSNPNLDKFYTKLDKLCFYGNENISILHIGGSHIQAGIWSWALREKFEKMMPGMEGAPGIVFPFSIAKTNHPYFYTSKTTGDWETEKITDRAPSQDIGLTGIMAYTSDSLASVLIKFNPVAKISSHKFDKISVFHNVEDTAYIVKILPEELVDTCIINIETGATEFYLKEAYDTVRMEIVKQDTSDTKFYFYGAYLESSQPGINYTGIGINGAATFSYLKADLFSKHLKAVKPDLAILSIGVNDAAGRSFSETMYISNYKRIIKQILEANPDCAIILTTNNDFYGYRGGVNQHYDEVYKSMVNISKHFDASVWNMFRAMGGYKSINLWRNDKIANRDRIHFTRAGYKIIAGLLFDAILFDYEEHLHKTAENTIIE